MNSSHELFRLFLKCGKVCTDTRNIIPGSIFFALKGANFDGNLYAQEALNQGCCLAVIDDQNSYVPEKTVLVEDVLLTLQELATAYRKTWKFPVIGITGSNGKTTTKELMNVVLSSKMETYATKGNLNNHIGVPLTILEIPQTAEVAIIEMGANHIGEIELLSNIACPDIGVITNIGKAHLEGFGSLEGVIQAKSELYQYLRSNHKTALVNSEDQLLVRLSEGIQRLYYGISSTEYKVENVNSSGFLNFTLNSGNTSKECQTHLIGEYNLYNCLVAIEIGRKFGIEMEAIINSIQNYIPENNRSQLLWIKNKKIILDAYNANPVSMMAALESFNSNKGEKLVILGDMFELGEYTHKEHLEIINKVNAMGCKSYLVGDIFSSVSQGYPNVKNFNDVDELIEFIKVNPISQNEILIKGSRGVKLEKVLEHI